MSYESELQQFAKLLKKRKMTAKQTSQGIEFSQGTETYILLGQSTVNRSSKQF